MVSRSCLHDSANTGLPGRYTAGTGECYENWTGRVASIRRNDGRRVLAPGTWRTRSRRILDCKQNALVHRVRVHASPCQQRTERTSPWLGRKCSSSVDGSSFHFRLVLHSRVPLLASAATAVQGVATRPDKSGIPLVSLRPERKTRASISIRHSVFHQLHPGKACAQKKICRPATSRKNACPGMNDR